MKLVRLLLPHLPLFALTCVLSIVQAAQVVGGPPLASGSRLTEIGSTWVILAWLVGDARRLRRIPCHDFGFLVLVTLPASLLWYLLWTRGWRGFLLLAVIFLGLTLVPWIVGMVAWWTQPGRA